MCDDDAEVAWPFLCAFRAAQSRPPSPLPPRSASRYFPRSVPFSAVSRPQPARPCSLLTPSPLRLAAPAALAPGVLTPSERLARLGQHLERARSPASRRSANTHIRGSAGDRSPSPGGRSPRASYEGATLGLEGLAAAPGRAQTIAALLTGPTCARGGADASEMEAAGAHARASHTLGMADTGLRRACPTLDTCVSRWQ